jgi:monovalent cation/proton antiporter MnhG/PhaG subunit
LSFHLLIDTLSWAALVAGSFFVIIGAVGLNRMPDVFSRMHATSVSDTLGVGLLIAGMVLQAGPTLVAVKLIFILLVLLMTGPIATHALAQAALQDKLDPLIADQNGRLTPAGEAEAIVTLEELSVGKTRQTPPKRPRKTERKPPSNR